MLGNLQAGNAALTIHRLDVESLFSQGDCQSSRIWLDECYQLGCSGLGTGRQLVQYEPDCAQSEPVFVLDDLHPTQTVHAELGQFALEELMLPGDFNRDGHIDAADISMMEAGAGGSKRLSIGAQRPIEC